MNIRSALAGLCAVFFASYGTAHALSDQTFTDLDGKTYSLFAELAQGHAFLIQHEDAW